MNDQPYALSPSEPTIKQVWLNAFTSLLSRLSPEEAMKEADRALELCNQRWKSPAWVWGWQYKHNYPVGAEFVHDPSLPPTDVRSANGDAAA